jgi:lipopolysaccharide transport system ATP-binding protein
MGDPVISVEGLGKLYRLGRARERHESLVAALGAAVMAPLRNLRDLKRLNTYRTQEEQADDLLWALKDVSFQVERGEVLGIIGRNGAGKSTLLKILSRITDPTQGRVRIRGRVSSLLEVGTGFHQDLTGRENVYLNGTILGMTKREIDRKFDEIVEFSGVSRFLDTPVKRYSSGMMVRLGFAVAAHLEPDVLIVDEVLAVGDAEFQRKCIGKMQDIATCGGRTVLFVSHNLASMRSLCSRAITLAGGQLVGQGSVGDQVSNYLGSLSRHSQRPLVERSDFQGSGRSRITGVEFLDAHGRAVPGIHAGDSLQVAVDYVSDEVGAIPEFAMSWFTGEGVKAFHVDTTMRNTKIGPLAAAGRFVCDIGRVPVMPGTYHVNLMIKVDHELSYHIYSAAMIQVEAGDFYATGRPCTPDGGALYLDHHWHHLDPAGAHLEGPDR